MFRNMSDTAYIFLGLVVAIVGIVAVAALTQGRGADAETQKALSYAVVGLVGALGGAARRKGE